MELRVSKAVSQWWKSFEKHPTLAWTLSMIGLLVISWIAFLWHLGSIGLVDETEPMFAEAARQMTVTGDWITPYFNSVTRFDKPPLIYWLMAIAYKLIGVNEWAVRLPSALSAISLTLFGFYTLRHFGVSRPAVVTQSVDSKFEDNPQIPNQERQLWLSAWIGATLIAVNPQTIVWARTGVSDMLLSGCMGSALLAFFLGYAQPSRPRVQARWYLAFYVLIALAILTKGPVGLVLPALIIGAFLLYLGNSREVLREMRPVRGVIITLILALPWYILVIAFNGPDYIEAFFGYHNVQRFTEVVNNHSAPWYFYFLVVLVGFAPWSSYLPIAIFRLRFWQQNRWRSSPRSTHLGLFALFWFAVIFGFFTIAVTKLPSYVLPLMPAAAILVALLWSDQLTREGKGQRLNVEGLEDNVQSANPRPPKSLLWSGAFNVVFLLVLTGAIFYSPNFIGYDPAAPNLAELVRQSGLSLIGGVIWGVTAIMALLSLVQKHQWRWLLTINLVGFLAFILFVVTPASFLMDEARQLPLRELAAIARQADFGNQELIMIGFEKPSLVFYSQRPVTYFKKTKKAIAYIKKKVATQPNPPSFLILTESKRLPRTGLKPDEYTHLGHAGGYDLIRVSKQVVAEQEVNVKG